MQIFRFEWKRSQKYILIWATALAVCIFFMTPVYYGMVETAGTLPAGFAQGGFLKLLAEREGLTLSIPCAAAGILAKRKSRQTFK